MNEEEPDLSSRDALIIALPPASALAAADGTGMPDDHGHWWRVIDGQVTQSGDRLDWLHPSRGGTLAEETQLLALAPAADVMLHRAAFPRLTQRQAEAAARLLVAEHSITPAASLHIALGPIMDGERVDGADGTRMVAVTDDALMAHWLRWLAGHGLDADHILPAALLVPAPDAASGDAIVRASVGSETILRSADAAFVAEPELVSHIVGRETQLVDVSDESIERAMITSLDDVVINLRSGKWAKAPPALFDAATLRRAAMIAGLILLVSLAILAARFVRITADTAALNSRANAAVASVLRTPPPIEQAIPQLDARLAALGGGTTRLSAPFAALVAAMEPAPTVALTTLAWRGDGTLSVTLAAPRAEDINTVLLALQARGYTITATPRSGTDGRALGDITIRSAP